MMNFSDIYQIDGPAKVSLLEMAKHKISVSQRPTHLPGIAPKYLQQGIDPWTLQILNK
jgi:hypothetical protein